MWPRVFMLVFGFGCALAAVAGVIAGPALVTQANMAGLLGPILFVVVVVGGLARCRVHSPPRCLIGLIQDIRRVGDASLADLFGAFGLTLDARSPFSDLWNVTVAQNRAGHPLPVAGSHPGPSPRRTVRDARNMTEVVERRPATR